jgi:phospholipase C
MRRVRAGLAAIIGSAALIALACSSDNSASPTPTPSSSVGSSSSASPSLASSAAAAGVHKIQHVVVIMQENRSFDSYFGTFPGADGIPMQNGQPTVCVNDPASGQCAKPFHDSNDLNHGGPHGQPAATADINSGKMDGFIRVAEAGQKATCTNQFDPACATVNSDVMGYHGQREIPNYWQYAEQFVLQDHMFEPNASWSLPEHLFMVSGWSAKCSTPDLLRLQERPAVARPSGGGRDHGAKLRLDGPDLPPAPGKRQLGVLRGARDGA